MDREDVEMETWLKAAILVSAVASFKIFKKAFRLIKDR
jgi:hypothetical protein